MFFKKFDFDPDPEMDPEPDPELSEKSDPDPEIIFSAPTHCLDQDPYREYGSGSGSRTVKMVSKQEN